MLGVGGWGFGIGSWGLGVGGGGSGVGGWGFTYATHQNKPPTPHTTTKRLYTCGPSPQLPSRPGVLLVLAVFGPSCYYLSNLTLAT